MNRRVLLWTATFGGVAIVAGWLLWSKMEVEVAPAAGSPERSSPQSSGASDTKDAATVPSATTPKSDRDLGTLLAKLSPDVLRYFDVGLNAGMEDVALYGQVVDQFDVPVAQVAVLYCVGGRYLNAGPGCGTKHTDVAGRFSILSRGGSVQISSIGYGNPDIEMQFPVDPDSNLQDFGGGQAMFYGYQHAEGGHELLWTDTSPEKPFVFRAWRIGAPEPVRVGWRRFGRLNPDGRLYTFDLSKKTPKQFAIEGVVDGHFLVSCQREPQHLTRDVKDVTWSVTITPIDGGMQLSDDVYMNVAPETGYQPAFVYDTQAQKSRVIGRVVDKRFYYTAKGGQVYGALLISFQPLADRNYCGIDILKFKLNESGSRNLASRQRSKW